MQNQVNMNPERTILSSTSPATTSPQFIISSSGVVNLSDIVLTNAKANTGMSFITFYFHACQQWVNDKIIWDEILFYIILVKKYICFSRYDNDSGNLFSPPALSKII